MMTPEEVKSGLAYCKDSEVCDKCPAHDKCQGDIIGQAYMLIVQQEEKIAKRDKLLAVMGVWIREEEHENT